MIRGILHYLWHCVILGCRKPIYWVRCSGAWRRVACLRRKL